MKDIIFYLFRNLQHKIITLSVYWSNFGRQVLTGSDGLLRNEVTWLQTDKGSSILVSVPVEV